LSLSYQLPKVEFLILTRLKADTSSLELRSLSPSEATERNFSLFTIHFSLPMAVANFSLFTIHFSLSKAVANFSLFTIHFSLSKAVANFSLFTIHSSLSSLSICKFTTFQRALEEL